MVCHVWFDTCGFYVWFVMCGLSCAVCHVWFVMRGLSFEVFHDGLSCVLPMITVRYR